MRAAHFRSTIVAAFGVACLGLPGVAAAAPGDLDPSFGTDGRAALGTDRRDAQGPPLVRSDGRIVVPSLLAANGRLAAAQLSADGTRDDAFTVLPPTGNETGTAQFALDGSGRLWLASGLAEGSKLEVARYNPDGTVDSSYGQNGRAFVAVPKAKDAVATEIVPTSDGRLYIAVTTNQAQFSILRLTAAGALDPTFSGDGLATATFGAVAQAGALDLQVLSNGSILAVGGAGDLDYEPRADTALARFTPTGDLDTTFDGDGKVLFDATGDGGFDFATTVVAGVAGDVTVAGSTANGGGSVARLTSAGALDTTFGQGGVQRGSLGAPDATGFYLPADLTLDPSGRIVLGGTTYRFALGADGDQDADYLNAPATWGVARLTTSGTAPLDASFGRGGRVAVAPCTNVKGQGLTGVAVQNQKLLALGDCADSGAVTVVRLLTTPALTGVTTLAVDPATEAAGHQRIRLDAIDADDVLASTNVLQSIGIRNSGIRNSGIRNSGIRNSGIRNSGIRNSGIRNSGIRNSALADPALGPQPLSAVPLRNNKSWTTILDGTIYEGVPLQSVTLGQVLALSPAPASVEALTLDDIALEDTGIRNSSLSALLLNLPIGKIAPPPGGWCDYLAGMPLNCSNGADLTKTTLLALELAGDDLKAFYARPILLAAPATEVAGSSLSFVELVDFDLADSPLGTILASEVASLLTCGTTCSGTLADRQAADPDGFSTANLGELIARLPVASLANVSLGGVITGLLPQDEIPYESAPRDKLLDAADVRPTNLQTATVSVDVDCAQAAGLKVVLTVPDGVRYVPKTGTVSVAGGTPRDVDAPTVDRAASTITFGGLDAVCAGRTTTSPKVTLRVGLEPGAVLGPFAISASASVTDGAPQSAAPVAVRVDDSLDLSDDGQGAPPITADEIRTFHLSSASDVDTFTYTPQFAGDRVTVTLSNLPADYDLVVYGPPSAGIRNSGIRNSGIRNSGIRNSGIRNSVVPDQSLEPLDPSVAQPNAVQDAGIRNSGIRNSSINRGTGDEAASFMVAPEDVGKPFTFEIRGYNGASSDEAGFVRVKESPNDKAPPCIANRTLQSGAPGTFPALPLAADRRTLFLVNRRRTAALYGADATNAMFARLQTLAARDDVRGVIVPVESDPTVASDAAYAAWDDDPCSVAKANAVVGAVNNVVDHVKASGLPELRSIVLVGPDDVLPQARLFDGTSIANQTEYADELVFDGKDNAISRAFREGKLLSDDPYGDFDPSAAARGDEVYVPDVALGRLVETPDQVIAQIDGYETADGILDPQTAYTSGYDFLSDGAQAVDDAISAAVPAGGATRDISETWDAARFEERASRRPAGLSSLNAHFNHYQSLPAAAFSGNGSPDLASTQGVTPTPGDIAFSMGCMSGLNIANVLISGPTDPRAKDWPEAYAAKGALWTGNTGYGYGDTEIVAYSERLMANMASQLASKKVTAGQALMFAKQRYAAGTNIGDDYDAKALQEATFYGLPMFRIGAAGGTGNAVLPDEGPASATRLSAPFDSVGALTRVDTDRGSYWKDGIHAPLSIQNHPIVPRRFVDVTADDGRPVHGALIEVLEEQAVLDVDPVNTVTAVDLEAFSPERQLTSVVHPAGIASISRTADPTGLKDRLQLVSGQVRSNPDRTDGRVTQRLFTRVAGKVFRSGSSDWTPPTIEETSGQVINRVVAFTVTEGTRDALGGNILFQTDADSDWNVVNLAENGPQTFGAVTPLPDGTQVTSYIVSLFDEAGNVGTGDNKGRGHVARPIAAPAAGSPSVTLDPAEPASGYYTASPTVGLDTGNEPDATYEYSIDGGPFVPYTAPFKVTNPEDGGHVVRFRSSNGTTFARGFVVDTQGPTVIGEPTTAPNGFGFYNTPVTVRFSCSDAVSGVATCAPDQTLATDGKNQFATGTATDRAGNTGTGRVGPINIDRTAPKVVVSTSGVVLDGTISGTSDDATSGTDRVAVTFTSTLVAGTATTRQATLSCNDGRTACTWRVASPGLGSYSVTARATDRADNEGTSAASLVTLR